MDAKVALYNAVDDEVTHYEVDVENATLTRRGTVKVPSFVQEGWFHPTQPVLYLTTSNRGPGLKADFNHLSAWRIDPASGVLTALGEPAPLPHRAVNVVVDPSGRYSVNAHNLPKSGLTIHHLASDGRIGAEVEQPEGLDYGIYPHQVMIAPSGGTVFVIDRGWAADHGKPEDPGALRSFDFDDGMLSPRQVVAPNGGYGFGPRHVDFHPSEPWMYVSDEKRSLLYMFRIPDDTMESEAAFTRDTLMDQANRKPRQMPSTIHVHPNGRTVYIANRADYRIDEDGRKVFGGGENTIAVYSIDPQTGEPTRVQNADTQSFHVRTFAFDPSGRLMVTASIKPMAVREGSEVKTVSAALSVFRVADDGKLEFVRKYDVDTGGGKTHYWSGIVGLE